MVLGDGELVGNSINGTNNFTGMIGMVLTNRADIIVAPVSVTAQRAAVVEFSIPIYEDATCILTTAVSNKGANRFLKIFQPFDYRVWLCIVLAIFIYALILYLIHHLITKKDKDFLNSKEYKAHHSAHHTTIGMYFFFMFGKLLTEGIFFNFNLTNIYCSLSFYYIDLGMQHLIYAKSERILLIFWWIFGIIINSIYTSVLVSLLIIIKYEPVINLAEDLATLNSYSLCLQSGGYQIEYFNVYF